MKIPPSGIDMLQTGKASAPAGADRPLATGARDASTLASAPTTTVHLHEFSSRIEALRTQVTATDPVDQAKVERIRQALHDGSFRVDAGVVADRLLDGAVNLLRKPSQ